MIHPTALIEPGARLGAGTTVGPYALIGAQVTIGLDCIVGAQVQLMGHTTVGAGNRFHAGAVIGDTPQDLKFGGEPTGLRIGVSNVFREHVTVHRSAKAGEDYMSIAGVASTAAPVSAEAGTSAAVGKGSS